MIMVNCFSQSDVKPLELLPSQSYLDSSFSQLKICVPPP